MYDPVIGRWTTQDPAMQFTNPYIFCGNNPVQYIDPDGEWILGALLGGIFNLTMDLLSGNLNQGLQMVRMGSFIRYRCRYGCVGFLCKYKSGELWCRRILKWIGHRFHNRIQRRISLRNQQRTIPTSRPGNLAPQWTQPRIEQWIGGSRYRRYSKRHSCRNSGKKFLERCRKDKQNYRRQTKALHPTGRSGRLWRSMCRIGQQRCCDATTNAPIHGRRRQKYNRICRY